MSDLVTWLREQLAWAEKDASEDHTLGCKVRDYIDDEDEPGPVADPDSCDCPVRMRLLEVEAKRRILDLHRSVVIGGDGADFFAEAPGCLSCDLTKPWPCPTLRALAGPYADRPGHDESWRP